MTETLAVGRITYPPGERVVVTFGTLPDPRDARIAQLEARVAELELALRVAMLPEPERDMTVTYEELDA